MNKVAKVKFDIVLADLKDGVKLYNDINNKLTKVLNRAYDKLGTSPEYDTFNKTLFKLLKTK